MSAYVLPALIGLVVGLYVWRRIEAGRSGPRLNVPPGVFFPVDVRSTTRKEAGWRRGCFRVSISARDGERLIPYWTYADTPEEGALEALRFIGEKGWEVALLEYDGTGLRLVKAADIPPELGE